MSDGLIFSGTITDPTQVSNLDNYSREIRVNTGRVNPISSPSGIMPTQTNACYESGKNIHLYSSENCNRDTIGQPCNTHLGERGICRADASSNGWCRHQCMRVEQRDPPFLNNLESYWDTNKNILMNLQHINTDNNPNPNSVNWVIAPRPSDINIVCSQSCNDDATMHPECTSPPIDIQSFCSNQRNSECCVCNADKWNRTHIVNGNRIYHPFFVGETEPTSYPLPLGYAGLIKDIPPSKGEKISNIFGVATPNEVGIKKIKYGYFKPFYTNGHNSENHCYFPMPTTNIRNSTVPTNKYYDYKNSMDHYAFARPILTTYLNREIDVLTETDPNARLPPNYYYYSSPSSILGEYGYYEQCFYSHKNSSQDCLSPNPRTNPSCPFDMINPQSRTNPSPINTSCTRCEHGEGEIYYGANECSPCPSINQIPHSIKPYGCETCPNQQYFNKQISDCTPCPSTGDTILTMCENNGSQICPTPSYEFNLQDSAKKRFYDDCYSHPSCGVSEHCIKGSIPVASQRSELSSISGYPPQPTYNLYMNEVCKTIQTEDNCNLVDECNWFGTPTNKCVIKFPPSSPNEVFIPMAIPTNISDPLLLYQLNAFPTPADSVQSDKNYSCNITGQNMVTQLRAQLPAMILGDQGDQGRDDPLLTFIQGVEGDLGLDSGRTHMVGSSHNSHMSHNMRLGPEHHISEFWNDLSTPTIPLNETNCNSSGSRIPSIRIPNTYTNAELNVYAHQHAISGSSNPIRRCEYHGCVDKDKYYEASIPNTIAPLCQELSDIYNYYNKFTVVKPASLSELVTNPNQYGCRLVHTP